MTTLQTESSLSTESLVRYVDEKILPHANRRSPIDTELPTQIYRDLHGMGWLQASIPAEYGGAGAKTIDLAVICRELAYGSAGVMLSNMLNHFTQTAIALYARPEIKREVFADCLSRFSLLSFAMTEADAGTDVKNIRTKARRVPGGFKITGQKSFITNGSVSDHLVVFAQLETEGITAFYMKGASDGLKRGKPLLKLGLNESDTTELFFEDVFVPEAHLMGTPGQGLKILEKCVSRSKTMLSAGVMGMCRRAFDLITAYLNERSHYGKPLLALPTIQGQLAQLQTEAEAGWLLVSRAADSWEANVDFVKHASMAKLFCTHTATQFISEVTELFGGYGVTHDYEISRLYRDVRAFEIVEGATLVQQVLVARALFPAPRK